MWFVKDENVGNRSYGEECDFGIKKATQSTMECEFCREIKYDMQKFHYLLIMCWNQNATGKENGQSVENWV